MESYKQMSKMRFLHMKVRYSYTYKRKTVLRPTLWVGIKSILHLRGRSLLLSDRTILHGIFSYLFAA